MDTNYTRFALEPAVPGGLVLLETIPAVDRPASVRLERYLAFLLAVRTSCLVHLAGAGIEVPSPSTHSIIPLGPLEGPNLLMRF